MLINLFSLPLKTGVFPEKIKIAQISQYLRKVANRLLQTTDQYPFFQ